MSADRKFPRVPNNLEPTKFVILRIFETKFEKFEILQNCESSTNVTSPVQCNFCKIYIEQAK